MDSGYEEEEKEEEEEEEEEEDDHGKGNVIENDVDEDNVPPTRANRRIFNTEALQLSLSSGRYPEYLGIEGPSEIDNPVDCTPLDYFFKLWPRSLMDVIVKETNRYGLHHNSRWVEVHREELVTFFGIITMMGLQRLPRIKDYWSSRLSNCCDGAPLTKFMPIHRFWKIWSNLHVVDNSDPISRGGGFTQKFQPVLSVLTQHEKA